MFKFKKILAFLLLTVMMFDCCKLVSRTEENYDNMFNNIHKLTTIKETEKYIIKYDKKINLKYLIFKDNTLSREEQNKIVKENLEDIRSAVDFGTTCIIITLVVSVVNLGLQIYDIYYKDTVQQRQKLNAVQNGWVSIQDRGRTLWFYKEGGYKKTGWYYDDYYESWYYFLDNGVMFDPRYSPSSWIRVNNKWYEFSNGGGLQEHSCWRKYGDEWLYHIPGDYGALAGSYFIDNDGTIYEFDENGYWK